VTGTFVRLSQFYFFLLLLLWFNLTWMTDRRLCNLVIYNLQCSCWLLFEFKEDWELSCVFFKKEGRYCMTSDWPLMTWPTKWNEWYDLSKNPPFNYTLISYLHCNYKFKYILCYSVYCFLFKLFFFLGLFYSKIKNSWQILTYKTKRHMSVRRSYMCTYQN